MVFRQSRAGRHMALVLLFGALAIWLFALWIVGTTLGLSLSNLSADLLALFKDETRRPTIVQLLPAFLMLVLIIAIPLLIWSLLIEAMARYEITDEGLRFRSWGVALLLPWETIKFIRTRPGVSNRAAELITNTDPLARASLRGLRVLQRQSLGRGRLPIFSTIEQQEALVAEIRRRISLTLLPA